MNTDILMGRFLRMGARLKLAELEGRSRRADAPLTLDIAHDEQGEFFDIRVRPKERIDLDVVDLRRRDRHLLLRAQNTARGLVSDSFYLCGHDEQHWFVAAVPESAGGLTSIYAAMEALKPAEVLEAQRRQGLKGQARFSRKNAAFVRQGEWFFLPRPDLRVVKEEVLYHEPLSRGEGSKPHIAECLYRKGGEAVYVCNEYPSGLTPPEYFQLLRSKPRAKEWDWRRMVRNPEAFVKGRISHPDHKTILLQVWHKVVMNTENQSQAMRHVVFLD